MSNNENSNYKLIALIIALTQFSVPFMFSGIGVILPSIGKELHLGGVTLGLIETMYIGAAAAFLLPLGKFSDATCKRAVFKTGLTLFALITFLLGFIHNSIIILALRFAQGASGAMITATNMAIITEVVPKERLGRAIGFSIGAVYLGLSAGPFFSGMITEHLGWRYVFFISSLVNAVTLPPVYLLIKNISKSKLESFDLKGTVLIVSAISLLIAGSSQLQHGAIGFLLIAAGFAFGFIFIKVEQNSKNPVLKISLITENKTLARALLIQVLNYTCSFGIPFLFSIYLQVSKGMSPQQTGNMLIIPPVFMAIFAPVFGRLSDSFPAYKLAGLGMLFCTISTAGASLVDTQSSIMYISVVFSLMGLGFAMFSSPNMNIIMSSVDKRFYSTASALSAKMRTLGMVFSMIFITLFIALIMGNKPITVHNTEDLHTIMKLTFSTFAALGLVGVLLSFRK